MYDDETILNFVKQGDIDKFNIIMERYSDRMKRTAYLITGDDRISEDCVQEMFIRLYYNIFQFRGQSSLSTWMYRILVNECRQKLRRSWYKRVVPEDVSRNEACSETNEDETLQNICIRNCLLKLSDKYREVLVLYYFNCMTVKEIGEALNTSQGTIKSRLKRARESLRPYLEKEGYGNEL